MALFASSSSWLIFSLISFMMPEQVVFASLYHRASEAHLPDVSILS
jgi:hypothetical protein